MLTPKCFARATIFLQERTLDDIMSKYWEKSFKIKKHRVGGI
jgi:hypothetical protein